MSDNLNEFHEFTEPLRAPSPPAASSLKAKTSSQGDSSPKPPRVSTGNAAFSPPARTVESRNSAGSAVFSPPVRKAVSRIVPESKTEGGTSTGSKTEGGTSTGSKTEGGTLTGSAASLPPVKKAESSRISTGSAASSPPVKKAENRSSMGSASSPPIRKTENRSSMGSTTSLSAPPVVSRLLHASEQRAKMLEKLQKEALDREMASCTFSPNLSVKSNTGPGVTHEKSKRPSMSTTTPASTTRKPGGERRLSSGNNSSLIKESHGDSYGTPSGGDDIWTRLSKSSHRNFSAMEEKKKILETKGCTFKPVIQPSAEAPRIVYDGSSGSVYQRLFDDAKTKQALAKPAEETTAASKRASLSPVKRL